MHAFSLTHVSEPTLDRDADRSFVAECSSIAWTLAYIAEYDTRKRYLERGYDSLYSYCLSRGLTRDSALKRIQAARAARDYPVIFEDVAAGRLLLSAVCLLAPHLNPQNANDLLAAARGKSKDEVEELVAQRFPRSELLPLVEVVPDRPTVVDAPGHQGPRSELDAPGHQEVERSMVRPLAPRRFRWHVSVDESMNDLLRYAQELMSHQLPSGDVTEVLREGLHLLVAKLEKQKFATTNRPCGRTRATRSPRHIPASVRRAVRERDGGRCTFVSEEGRRCTARKFLEFDHVQEVARGGHATVEGIRLRCRAHNQYTAERTFGAGFMDRKRQEARRATEERARAASEAARKVAEDCARAEAEQARERSERANEVVPYLRHLGFRKEQAVAAVTHVESMTGAALEDRVRAAISFLGRKPRNPVCTRSPSSAACTR